jgi:hypothetical protein
MGHTHNATEQPHPLNYSLSAQEPAGLTPDVPACLASEDPATGAPEGSATDAPEGYFLSPKCWGTYMHGILDNRPVVEYLLQQAGMDNIQIQWSDYTAFKQRQYDDLAGLIRQHVDLPSIYRSLRQPVKNKS